MVAVEETFPPVPFDGFDTAALDFFRDLAAHQDKAWMAEHKTTYERLVKEPLVSFVAALSDRFAEEGLGLRGDPARSVFRLNRDVRFSKNKDPYKTNASAVLSRDGGKQSPGLLYFHLDPAGSFVATGFYQCEPDVLQRMRRHLVDKPTAWIAVESDLADAGLSLDRSDTLVRPPKGFETVPSSLMSAVKLKSWIVRQDLSPKQIQSSDLVERVVAFALSAAPLLTFGWSAVDHR